MAPEFPGVRGIIRTVITVVLVLVALYLIYLLRKPLGWLLIATFMAVALSGPVNFLHRHMKRGLAITIVYLGLLMIPVAIGAIVVPPLVNEGNELAENMPEYARDISKYVQENETLNRINEDYNITDIRASGSESCGTRISGSIPPS